MDWLRHTGVSIFLAAMILLAVGVPSVFGHVPAKQDTRTSCCHPDEGNHENDSDPGDHECHCLIHGGTMLLPEPLAFPIPGSELLTTLFPHQIFSPEPLAFAIDYPPQR